MIVEKQVFRQSDPNENFLGLFSATHVHPDAIARMREKLGVEKIAELARVNVRKDGGGEVEIIFDVHRTDAPNELAVGCGSTDQRLKMHYGRFIVDAGTGRIIHKPSLNPLTRILSQRT
jgi:hypothetical protein